MRHRSALLRSCLTLVLVLSQSVPTLGQASITLDSPSQNITNKAIGATIPYSGSVSWNGTDNANPDQACSSVELDIYWTYYTPLEDSRNTGANLGTSDTEYATISNKDTVNGKLDFSGSSQDGNALTAAQYNGYSSYYWVMATPLKDHSKPYFKSPGGTQWSYVYDCTNSFQIQ